MVNKTLNTITLVVISIGIIAFLILLLAIIFNNIPADSISSTTSETANQTVLVNNATTTTLAPVGEGIISLSATKLNVTWLSFSGTSDQITTTHLITSPINSTYSFWINTSQTNSTERVILNINETDGMDRVLLVDGIISWQLRNETYDNFTINSSIINDSSWHNIVLQYVNGTETESGNASIFVDGTLMNDSLVGLKSAFNSTLIIGKNFNNFSGYIDEIRIYNESLTTSEITQISDSGREVNYTLPTTNLDLWMPINENKGTAIHYFHFSNSIFQSTTDTGEGTQISGASWANDGNASTLTADTDYSLSGSAFTIINRDLSWTQVNTSWSYTLSSTRDDLRAVKGNYSTSLVNTSTQFPTIGTIIGIAILLFILIALLVFAIRKMMGVSTASGMSKDSGNSKFKGSSREFS